MGIHTGPKDGDYARYMEFLSSGSDGEPGKVYTSRQAAPAQWSTESEAPPLPDGFKPEPVAINPMVSPERAQRPGESSGWSLPALDDALGQSSSGRQTGSARSASTFPDPAVEGKPVVVLPGQGGAWDARDAADGRASVVADRHAGVTQRTPGGVQRIVSVVATIAAWILIFNAVSSLFAVATLGYNTDVEHYLPGAFMLIFGIVLLRISKGVRKNVLVRSAATRVTTTRTGWIRKK